MARPRHSLFVLHTVLVVLLMSVLDCKVTEAQELLQPPALPPTVLHPSNSLGRCENDKSLNDVCRACAALPPRMSLPVEECCTDDDASAICKQCLSDPVFCLVDLVAIENALFTSADLGDAEDDVGEPPQFDAIADDEDDDFTDMTQDSEDDDMETQKRWGTLGLGSSRYGRYSRGFWSPGARQGSRQAGGKTRWNSLALDKRWGSLGIGHGKRWGSLGLGRGWGSRLRGRKRWGSLAIGKRRGSSGFGEGQAPGSLGEQQGSVAVDKRWGSLGLGGGYRLGLGSSGRRWGPRGFGRRSAPDVSGSEPLQDRQEGVVDQENLSEANRPLSTDKRWGSLGLGGWRKRWGTLGFGRRSALDVSGSEPLQDRQEGLVDQENPSEANDPLSTDKRWGSLGLGGWRKRWGTLGFGRRSATDVSTSESLQDGQEGFVDPENLGEANRPLFTDKRWGSLGLGGWRKRWGTLGFGKRSVSDVSGSDTSQDGQEDVVDQENLSETNSPLSTDKRWGSLGLGGWRKRWGTLGFGRRSVPDVSGSEPLQGGQEEFVDQENLSEANRPLSADKRWGSLGLGGWRKRWGTLGFGRRSAPDVTGSDYPQDGQEEFVDQENPSEANSPLSTDKRWGSLGLGGWRKRWGTLGIGRRSASDISGSDTLRDSQDGFVDLENPRDADPPLSADKRWGSLGLGGWRKRWGTLGFGRRSVPDVSSSEPPQDSQEGFVDPEDPRDADPPLSADKRWGSLGLGGWRKRWGSLGLGGGRRWGSRRVGKRQEALTGLDDDSAASLDSNEAGGKRWGTLSLGKRSAAPASASEGPNPDPQADKRWGTLGLGNRWGKAGRSAGLSRWSLLGFGGKRSDPSPAREGEGETAGGESGPPTSTGGQVHGLDLENQHGPGVVGDAAGDLPGAVGKRWGTLFMGKRNADADTVGEGSDDPAQKKWGSLGIGKKWGSLGIGKKWGSLGIGKKWGSLGIGKKWGSLGIGKKWGSLGIGKKSSTSELSGQNAEADHSH